MRLMLQELAATEAGVTRGDAGKGTEAMDDSGSYLVERSGDSVHGMLRRIPTWGKVIIALGLLYLAFWVFVLGLGYCDAPPGSRCA